MRVSYFADIVHLSYSIIQESVTDNFFAKNFRDPASRQSRSGRHKYKKELLKALFCICDPTESRTPVNGLKTRCPDH